MRNYLHKLNSLRTSVLGTQLALDPWVKVTTNINPTCCRTAQAPNASIVERYYIISTTGINGNDDLTNLTNL